MFYVTNFFMMYDSSCGLLRYCVYIHFIFVPRLSQLVSVFIDVIYNFTLSVCRLLENSAG
jgi:hypothetical protein